MRLGIHEPVKVFLLAFFLLVRFFDALAHPWQSL
jgi:hypothetical protein